MGFIFLGEVAVGVAINVNRVPILNEPDASFRFLAENQQTIPRLRFVFRLLGNGPVNLRQIGCRKELATRKHRESKSNEMSHFLHESLHSFHSL